MANKSAIAIGWVVSSWLTLQSLGCTVPAKPPEVSQPVSAQAFKKAIAAIPLPAVAPELRNVWSPELEAEFEQRAATIINHFSNPKGYGNGYGENEKSAYPRAMFDFLAGNRSRAIAFLEAEDPQPKNHAHTEGIDYYYSFTLKGQIRKYFLLGKFLDPAYKQRLFLGAKKWTERDPLTRPHPLYGYGDGSGRDWDISRRGGWVDSRNTDNLRAMRETSVYLMAEETGNEATRRLYKQKIQRYVWALYHIGMGEWDSSVYHGHTFAPYLNLYDFAKDPEVKQLAKAALDWMSAAAAIKYYRGGWGGPVKRDYGTSNVVFGSSAVQTFWLYFGDNPLPNPSSVLDTLYLITSTYRPPQAIVALARKQFKKPVEILSTKPLYENWKPGKDKLPGYWETQFFGQTYQMGSVAGTFADGDVIPFRLMAYNTERGVDYFAANTGKEGVRPGKNSKDEMGQFRNLLIWLRPASEIPFFFQVPKTAKAEIEDNIWFFKFEKTWLAVRPINLKQYTEIALTDRKFAAIYSQERILQALSQGYGYEGFALEVGEANSYGNYEEFKQRIKHKSKLDLSELLAGKVSLQDAQGNRLEFTYQFSNLLPSLVRNGTPFNWFEHLDLYKSLNQDNAPIALGWKRGTLTVKAGGLQYSTALSHSW